MVVTQATVACSSLIMNCFTHAIPFLSDPTLAVGCCVPDWLSAADRKCRIHEKSAAKFTEDSDPFVASVARGIIQHHQDDAWFHRTPSFIQVSQNFAISLRGVLRGNAGHRPSLLGHILVELLLDGWLITHNPGKLEQYYDCIQAVAMEDLQNAVNRMATKPTTNLTRYFAAYVDSRLLFDFTDDEQLLKHVNAILKRVRQEPLTDSILPWLGAARAQVYQSAQKLLAGRDDSIISTPTITIV